MQFLQNARRAAPSGSRGGYVPNISPYKDGAYPRSDANSFPICTLTLDAGREQKGQRKLISQNYPYCPRPSFNVC